MSFLQLLKESLLFAFQALTENKVRAFLSLLGISIGIFCIIGVYTLTDSLESSIRKQFESLGSNIVFVQKWSFSNENAKWWKIMNWPEPSYEEYKKLKKRQREYQSIAFTFSVSGDANFEGNTIENVSVNGVTQSYQDLWGVNMEKGRFFSQQEENSQKPFIVLGSEIAQGFFEGRDPIGKSLKVFGKRFTVIGVMEKQGAAMFGPNLDESVFIPASKLQSIVSRARVRNSSISIKSIDEEPKQSFLDEIMINMRSIRRIPPKGENNFSLNKASALTESLNMIFGVIGMAGTIIGSFAILVGGFGIANIMFVSVKERTPQIGIQKSLGARSRFLLFQFLFEAVFLSILGGGLGIFFTFIGVQFSGSIDLFEITLTLKNILLGLTLSSVIGLVAGIAPAYLASKLDPVEAIRRGG